MIFAIFEEKYAIFGRINMIIFIFKGINNKYDISVLERKDVHLNLKF